MAASESYPDDLLYHPEHDWARIDGDEAVLGVTWYRARLARRARALRASGRRDSDRQGRVLRRGRVGQGRLRPDRAALGRGARGQRGRRRRPETVNDDPYGAGWLVRIRLADPAEPTSCSTPPPTASVLAAQ